MAILARERIFKIIEMQKGADARSSLYEAVRKEFPNIDMTEEWLTVRHRWLVIAIDCNAEDRDVEQLETCRRVLLEMGFPDDDTLMRAIIFCNADISQITYALRALDS